MIFGDTPGEGLNIPVHFTVLDQGGGALSDLAVNEAEL